MPPTLGRLCIATHNLQNQGVFVWLCHEDAVCYKGCCGLCVWIITVCGGSLPSGCEVYNLSVLLLFISLILLIHPACQTAFPSGDMFLFHSIPKHGLLWQGTLQSNLLRRFFEVFPVCLCFINPWSWDDSVFLTSLSHPLNSKWFWLFKHLPSTSHIKK